MRAILGFFVGVVAGDGEEPEALASASMKRPGSRGNLIFEAQRDAVNIGSDPNATKLSRIAMQGAELRD
jgi:hypothetical protein